jgi:hypothetical protein
MWVRPRSPYLDSSVRTLPERVLHIRWLISPTSRSLKETCSVKANSLDLGLTIDRHVHQNLLEDQLVPIIQLRGGLTIYKNLPNKQSALYQDFHAALTRQKAPIQQSD